MHDPVVGAALPSVMALAYLGDAVYSLYVRKILVARGITKSGALNAASLDYVTAGAQARRMQRLAPHLLPDEADVVRRAANSTHLNRPKKATGAEYRQATGFEALLGMLYWLGDEERLSLLLTIAHEEDENDDSEN